MSEEKKENWLHRLADWIWNNPGPTITLGLLLAAIIGLWFQNKSLQVQIQTLQEQLKAPELAYSKSWYPKAAEPEEVQIRQAADGLYRRFFTEVNDYLEANPQDDYEAVLEALLPMTTTIPSARGGTLRIIVRNEGERTEETIRVIVEASKGWTITTEKYEGTESATIIEGGEGHSSIKYEVDRLVPDHQFEINLSFDSSEEFTRQLTLQGRRGMEDFEKSLRYWGYPLAEDWEPTFSPWMLGIVDEGIEIVALSPSFPDDLPPRVEVTGASGKARESSPP